MTVPVTVALRRLCGGLRLLSHSGKSYDSIVGFILPGDAFTRLWWLGRHGLRYRDGGLGGSF